MGFTRSASIITFTGKKYEERARVTIGHLDLLSKFEPLRPKRQTVKDRDQMEEKHSLPAHCPPFHCALVPPPKNANERLMTFKASETGTQHMLRDRGPLCCELRWWWEGGAPGGHSTGFGHRD